MESAGNLGVLCTSAVLQPLVTEALIKRLEDVFPSAPTRATLHREVDFGIGQQEVIGYLRQLLIDQQTEPLDLEAL
jgi:hypothetical protein